MSTLFHGYKKLKYGDLSLLYKEGEIRQVCLGRVQIINAIYAAVRDQNWTTIPFKVSKETIEKVEDGFTIELSLRYSMGKILYNARMSIEATGNKLLMNYDGEAGSTFLRNRIGLCILHPLKECRGEPVLISHPEGSPTEGCFPELISPDQPFKNISGMYWTPGKGITAGLIFEGEVFESEDQRNWTDASYKTYCTPLDRPFPAKVEKGDQIHQSVSLMVEPKTGPDQPLAIHNNTSSIPEKRILNLDPDKTYPLPGLGAMRTTELKSMTQEELKILSALPLHHYRVDLHLAKDQWKEIYNSAASEQHHLGWPLELVLHFGANPNQELEAFLKHYSPHPVTIRHLLVFDQDFLSNKELLNQVVPRLNTALRDIPVGGGSEANFAELNRKPPDAELLDFISYSICPQIHAFDKLTLMENLEAQPESVKSALSLMGKPVSIGALTLKQRFNAVATDNDEDSQPLPESDPRQHSSFSAGWTLSSIRNLALAGASSLTYFETVGPRGILCRQDIPERHSPLYQLFKEILTGDPRQVIQTESSHPLEFDGLALQGQSEGKLLLANYTAKELSIECAGLPGIPQKLTLKPSEIYKISYTP